jgi:hypothetical protein
MSDNNGKIILSLIAGATAGVVAGLLLAPETGEETRSSFRKSATKLGDDLGKFFQETLSKVTAATSPDAPNAEAGVVEDRAAADQLFSAMNDVDGGDSPASDETPAAAKGDNATTAGL